MKQIEAFHAILDPSVRDVQWTSNCAGEIFVQDGSESGLRIGHFQGDANLAAFVVAAHTLMLTQPVAIAIDPLQDAGDNPDFLFDFLVHVAGQPVSKEIEVIARETLGSLLESFADLSIASTVEAFEAVPALQEFAGRIRAAALPGQYAKWFNQSGCSFLDNAPVTFDTEHLSLQEKGLLLKFVSAQKP